MNKFDKGFVFGTATSSYQIEGAHDVDGRTDSIWDVFSRTPGKVHNGDTGDIACDHYNRYEEDVELLKELGVESYRFSIAWPRIFPEKGKYNSKGMEFYKKLIKALKNANIKPAITLYHWDLPMWAENEGGWTNRECVDWFCEYAEKCFEELGNEVDSWITHNEPFCSGFLGHYTGEHAPGIKSLDKSLKAIHHILLSHGKAVKIFRERGFNGQIGITLNLSPAYPNDNTINDRIACNNCDGFFNRWFLDPVFKGTYPMDMINLFTKKVKNFSFIKEGDLETISVKNDFLGINYYSSNVVEYSTDEELLFKFIEQDTKKTDMNWAITPSKLKDLIRRIREEYTNIPIYITENGAAFKDVVNEDGKVYDTDRIDYIKEHLKVISQLNEEGMNVAGYYLWSFMDNFEWAFGYSKRFGIVYVDYDSLKRIKKESFYEYSRIIKNRYVE
ncbi:GH1 family beta-glucosidase [Caldisalinibacter kiritimatiensis]|uniref:Beta-glucosidase n=1 Tax=Caldisalinibacter kiritimatiensis TaxID=1304284 RepID=R1CUK8_9FIRM|nr:GH1 family beta-glucosidase [Caldisalinibacter kiritimatiensis]EOD00354.1 Beta-glucosidase [Caldisalinibacter kiritimatiensis]